MSQESEKDVGELTAEDPGGFTQVPSSLLLNGDVSDGAYRLYALLKHHARQKGSSWPGRKLLAKEMGVKSVRTVDARVSELKHFGYLVVTPRFHSAGGQRSNLYHLRFYPVQNSAPPPGNTLRPPGADDCAPPSQGSAHQEEHPSGSRPTPTPLAPAAAKPTLVPSPETPTKDPGGGRYPAYVNTFVNLLPSQVWPRTATQRSALVELVSPFSQAWAPEDLARAVSQGLPEEVTHPVGLLKTRLKGLPERSASQPDRWPDWCGLCDEETRHVDLDDDAGTVRRCPHCHPAVVKMRQENAS